MVHIGIIGSGFGRYGLLPAFSKIPGCRAVAISRLDEEKLDAVAIAVPPDVQYTIAKAAIEKGLHVFAEKPLADTFAHAQDLLARATKRNIVHGIDFLFPEIDVWQKAKKILDSGTLGDITAVLVNWDFLSYDLAHKRLSWKTDAAKGGGALSFYFSHSLYYLEYFVGKISDIHSEFSFAKERGNGAETGIDMLMKFKNGVKAVAHINCAAAGRHEHRLVFQCEKGAIVLSNENSIVDNFSMRVFEYNRKERTVFSTSKIDSKEDGRVKVVAQLAARFIRACKQKTPMFPSFTEGARVAQLVEMVRANQLP